MKGSQGKKKPGRLTQHFTSKAHQAAMCDFINFVDERGQLDFLLDKSQREKLIEEERLLNKNKDVIMMLFDVARTLARQGIAFRGTTKKTAIFTKSLPYWHVTTPQ